VGSIEGRVSSSIYDVYRETTNGGTMNLIPFAEDFEKAVIVSVLSDPMLLPRVNQIINADDFFKTQHKEIFAVIEDIGVDNLDSLTVEDKLKEETKEYFKNLVEDSNKFLPGMSNIMYYADTIKGKSRLRAGIDLGRDIVTLCYAPDVDADEALHQLEQKFSTFLQQKVLDSVSESSTEAFKEFFDNLGKNALDPNAVKSGFRALDLMLHRLEGLIVLAARPGMGKTAFAINIARNVADKRPVLFFSVEQTREQIFERMLAAEAEVGLEDIRTGAFLASPTATQSLDRAKSSILGALENIHVDEKSEIPTSYISSVARQKKYEWGDIGLIVVDYLHILKLNNKQTVDALGDATKEIRALGKELDCPVLLLAQLRRLDNNSSDGKRKTNKRPELSDLRSSGEIEQSADVVVFLHRDSYYGQAGLAPDDDLIEVIVKKHRNGRQGIATLRWLPKYVKFKDL
jgi:replicative DNA helicase